MHRQSRGVRRVGRGEGRHFIPWMDLLESRRLLSLSAVSASQDGTDLVGPDASQGPDGIQDLHIHLAGLQTTAIDHVVVQGPNGFRWQSMPNPTGASLAEIFPSGSAGADLYINPQVRAYRATPGGSQPLGGSTGALMGLASDASLTITVYYSPSSHESATLALGKAQATLTSPTAPVHYTTQPPANVPTGASTFRVEAGARQQADGRVRLVVDLPTAGAFDRARFLANFGGVGWKLSDLAGYGWDSRSPDLDNRITATLDQTTSSPRVYLDFAPIRDESPPAGAWQATMTLLVTIPEDAGVYTCSFAGGAWDPGRLAAPTATASVPVVSSEAQLRAFLGDADPRGEIRLDPSRPIVIQQPIRITHSIKIDGDGASVVFSQGNSGPWPYQATGAFYVANGQGTNIRVEFANFRISFDQSAPIAWANPPGAGPATWSPTNNPGGYVHAVIDTGPESCVANGVSLPLGNNNMNRQALILSGMNISGPPAFEGASFAARTAALTRAPFNDALHRYAGEMALDLIRTNGNDTGTIAGCTFMGGSILLRGGPWSVTDNRILGPMPYSFSSAAFGLQDPHDVLLRGNQVGAVNPSATLFRLVNLAGSGYNNTIEDNSFVGGQIGNEVTYNANASNPRDGGQVYPGINDGEVMLEEGNSVLFAGRPAFVSTDGKTLVLPTLRSPVAHDTGPGLIVSILAGQGRDGSPDRSYAGTWYRVATQIVSSPYLQLLMQDPLPPMPGGGYYTIEVTPGFVNSAFINNTITMTGTSSTGLKVDGNSFGLRVIDNRFTGGYSSFTGADGVTTYYDGTAMLIGAGSNSRATSLGTFGLPSNWTVLPALDTVIQGNTIVDSPGGMVLGVEHSWANVGTGQVLSVATTGRVYFTASVTGNTFLLTGAFLDPTAWPKAFASTSLGNNPADSPLPPTITIGSGSGAIAANRQPQRIPWTVGGIDPWVTPDQPRYGQSHFVDPAENVVVVRGNAAYIVASDGTRVPRAEPSGQVFEGVVNGVVRAPKIGPSTFDGRPYYAFDQSNLDIAARSGVYPVQALAIGQDNFDLIGSGITPFQPDGIQDLHIALTDLGPAATIAVIDVVGTAPGEHWRYPATKGTLPMILIRAAGSTRADLFLASAHPHLADTFTVRITYAAAGRTVILRVPGIRFSPLLHVQYSVPPSPLNLSATSSSRKVALTWRAVPGATRYIVERSTSLAQWSVLSTRVTSLNFLDTRTTSGATYFYRIRAVSRSGVISPYSSIVSVRVAG